MLKTEVNHTHQVDRFSNMDHGVSVRTTFNRGDSEACVRLSRPLQLGRDVQFWAYLSKAELRHIASILLDTAADMGAS